MDCWALVDVNVDASSSRKGKLRALWSVQRQGKVEHSCKHGLDNVIKLLAQYANIA